jgi:HK97 family phage prohead protease
MTTEAISFARKRMFANDAKVAARGPAAASPPGEGLRIAGYASLFGVADLSRDVVEAGAFAAALTKRGAGGIRMLFQHDPARPVGVWTSLREDARGLAVQGRLTVGAAGTLAALIVDGAVDGAVDGLSIGFRTIRARTDPHTRLRHILEADLWEISIVNFPMLTGTRLSALQGPGPAPVAMEGTTRAAAFAASRN